MSKKYIRIENLCRLVIDAKARRIQALSVYKLLDSNKHVHIQL